MRPVTAGLLSLLALSLSFVPSPRPALAAGTPGGRFTSFLGGTGMETARAVAVDDTGAIFVVGSTTSTDFPVKNALAGSLAGGADAFVAKLAADGRTVLWATYLGGSGDDQALCVAPDSAGNVWVAGDTTSPDFPTVNPLQNANAGGRDGFLVRLASDGGSILYSSFLGGSGDDSIAGMGLDGAGNVWVTGSTGSPELPVTSDAFQPYYGGATDAFLAEFTPDGASLLHATFLGGAGGDGALALAVEPSGMVTVCGYTGSYDFPTAGARQGSLAGGTDAFILRYDGTNATVVFSTYFGGSGDEAARAVAFNDQGLLAVAGTTTSPDLPLAGALQPSLGGSSDAFVLSLTSDGSTVRYATYLGGSGEEEARAVAFNDDGSTIVAGMTTSVDLTVVAGTQTANAGMMDGFLARISRSGNALGYATYLGGSGDDALNALTLDAAGVPVVAGVSNSADLPLVYPFQADPAGSEEAVVARILASPAPPEGLAVEGMSQKLVTISWIDPSGGRCSFEVQRTASSGPWTTVAALDPGTTTWTDTTVEASTSYRYRVRAILDGVPSDYTTEVFASTPAVPPPARPGVPVLTAESAGLVLVEWADLSDNEITFEVFRSADGGPFVLIQSVGADTTSWEDAGVTADRAYSYEVRAVGVMGPSAVSEAATVSTPATLSLDGVVGKRVDVARLSRDTIALSARFSSAPGGLALDPRTGGFQVGVDGGTGPALLVVQPGSEGWKERKGVFTWKSQKGSTAKVTLVLDTVRGTFRLKASHLQLGALASGDIRTWIRCGTDGGSTTSSWEEKKPGVLVCR